MTIPATAPTALLGSVLEHGQDGVAEPMLTLSQVQQLLREATAYERAQRPIVLHTAPAQPFASVAPQTAVQGHPGIDIPAPGPQAPEERLGGLRRLYTRAELVYCCALTTFATGTAGVLAPVLGPWTMALPIGGLLTCLGAAARQNHIEAQHYPSIVDAHWDYEHALRAGTAPHLPLMPRSNRQQQASKQIGGAR